MLARWSWWPTQGPEAFYSGAIAAAFLKTCGPSGRRMTAADLADFRPEWVEPISTDYHGWKVYELPPNGQGIGALEMLNYHGALSARRSTAATAPRNCK